MVLRVEIEADGGSRGNPGPSGYGAVVRNADTGEVLRDCAGGIGIASNNVAEYRGLIAGLEAAIDLGADEVAVRMDSKLVVMQMSNRWQVKHPDMKMLAREAAGLLQQIPKTTFMHIPREQNKYADRLANEAMDDQAAGREWTPREPKGAAAAAPAAAVPTVAAAPTVAAPDAETKPSVQPYGWSAPSGVTTVAMLLRHGETALSIEKRFSGRGEQPLTERGEKQAAAAAQRLARSGIEVIVSSPLRRTRQTAAAVADLLGISVEIDEGFAETDFGEWEGLTFGELGKQAPEEMRRWLGDPTVAPPGGESMASTAARVAAARGRVLEKYAGNRVLIVTHVTPIKCMLRDAIGAPMEAVYRIHLDPASLSVVDWRAQGPSVVRLMNETSHLGEFATSPGF